MVDRIRSEAAIVERVGELAKSYGIEVKQVSYRPMADNVRPWSQCVSLDRKVELTVFLDMGDNKRLHEIKIRVEDIDKTHEADCHKIGKNER